MKQFNQNKMEKKITEDARLKILKDALEGKWKHGEGG